MRFLANDNFPRAAVSALAAAGHDIVWVRTAMPGAADSEVLARAGREGRILLTFDKDFGELAGRATMPSACGIILFRIPVPNPAIVDDRLMELITARDDWAGHFSVIAPGRVRMRRLRQPGPAARRACR